MCLEINPYFVPVSTFFLFFIKGSTEIANFDFRGDGRFTFEVEEEARDCFSWQQDQVDRKHKRLL